MSYQHWSSFKISALLRLQALSKSSFFSLCLLLILVLYCSSPFIKFMKYFQEEGGNTVCLMQGREKNTATFILTLPYYWLHILVYMTCTVVEPQIRVHMCRRFGYPSLPQFRDFHSIARRILHIIFPSLSTPCPLYNGHCCRQKMLTSETKQKSLQTTPTPLVL